MVGILLPTILLLLQCSLGSGFGPMSTISTMEGRYSDSEDSRTPLPNNYAVCVLQAANFKPRCTAMVTYSNNTQAPNATLYALVNGLYFTCGLRYEDRTAVCWGDIELLTTTTYSELSAGGFHFCGLKTSGFVDCWGDMSKNQTQPRNSEIYISLASGRLFTCGLTIKRTVVCWGKDISGGGGPPTKKFAAIFAGGQHVCGLTQAGKALCWGASGKFNETNSPVDITFATLAAGMYHTCGLRIDSRESVCWGDNTFHQLESPQGVSFLQITASAYYTCGVRLKDQNIQCWGNDIRLDVADVGKVAPGLCKRGSCGNGQRTESNACPGASDVLCLDNVVSVSALQPAAAPAIASPNSANSNSHGNNSGKSWVLVGSVASVALLFVGMSMVLLCMLCNKHKEVRRATSFRTIDNDLRLWQPPASRLIIYTASELHAATQGYHDSTILGKGTYGTVYRGTLESSQVVAIKRACEPGMNSNSFSNELELLGRLHHKCLVNILGFCKEEMLVVYEFMENGSLFDCLFTKAGLTLDWNTRLKIAVQAARGLEYLHVYASPPIIHRDVKTANILLDKGWNAHVSDFGLSRGLSPLGPPLSRSYAGTTVTVVGTPGFVDPEYFQTSYLTTKSDVYSFGVVLLELVTGQRTIDARRPGVGIVSWVPQEGRELSEVVDPTMYVATGDLTKVSQVLGLALQCTKSDGRMRPAMTGVLACLEGICSNNSSSDNDPTSDPTSFGFSAGSSADLAR